MRAEIGAEAVDAAFVELGITGCQYTPPVGPVITGITLMLARPDEEAVLGETRGRVPSVVIDARAAEVANPARDGVFRIDGTNYRILAAPERRDPSRLVWRCPAIMTA